MEQETVNHVCIYLPKWPGAIAAAILFGMVAGYLYRCIREKPRG